MKAKRYDVLSPDGFSIEINVGYNSRKKAKEAFERWVKRYEKQGYYSSNNGRIPLDELEQHCHLIEY